MASFSFKGGVHPRYFKELAREKPIQKAQLANQFTVPLTQHGGKRCEPAVAVGDTVEEGQLIGTSREFFSALIHSPVSGKVKKIERCLHPLGGFALSVIIEPDGTQARSFMEPLGSTVEQINPEDALARVKEAGIVGLGGAAFPAHVKYFPLEGRSIDTLIINGCECEPYLTADYRLMVERTDDLVLGARIIARILSVDRVVIAVENNKPLAIEGLADAVPGDSFTIAVAETKYPQGAEKMLIKAVLNREVPRGGLPLDVGVVVANVGTAVAVCEAVRDGKPLIERVVTVTGHGVKDPGNFLVKIGTPVSDLVRQAGGTGGSVGRLIMGGPMMGIALSTFDVPVIKGTSGMPVMTEASELKAEYLPCIKCSFCVRVCPIHLLPSTLSVIAEVKKWEQAEKYGVFDCIECGCCDFVCPSKRPIVQWVKTAKASLRKIGERRKK